MRKYWFRNYINLRSVTILDVGSDMTHINSNNKWVLLTHLEIENELTNKIMNHLFAIDLYTNRITDFEFLLNTNFKRTEITEIRINI